VIRSIVTADIPVLLAICEKAGVFSTDDLVVLGGLFDRYHGTAAESGHYALTYVIRRSVLSTLLQKK
jgi:hypothetical protein